MGLFGIFGGGSKSKEDEKKSRWPVGKPVRDTEGPVVKSGPNRGQNRARNKDGAWRAKRNDAGKPRSR